MALQRHETYYIDDLVIQVEHTLFRVPRSAFLQSEVFRDMLTIPQGELALPEGGDDDHPLILEGYFVKDFVQLLRVLLPQGYPPVQEVLTPNQWMSVLQLATTWNFAAIRPLAIAALQQYASDDPILRIIAAKRFNIPAWFVPALNMLSQRSEVLSDDEMKRLATLGSMWSVCRFLQRLSKVRESYQIKVSTTKSSTCTWPTIPEPNYDYGYSNSRPMKCQVHQGQPPCCDRDPGYLSNFQGARSSYDFTSIIAKVFDCLPNPGQSNDAGGGSNTTPGPPLPQDSSWDFS